MNAWIDALNVLSATWLDLLFRASWQGGIALAVVWLIARFVSRLPAAHKVWLWRLAFLKLLAGLIWLSPVVLPILPQQRTAVPVVTGTIPATLARAEAAADLPQPARFAVTTTTIEPVPSSLQRRAWLFLAWVGALSICALRVVRHWRDTRRLVRGSRPLSNGAVLDCVRALSKRLRLRRPPSISESPAISSPVLVGILQPHVILPRGLADSVSPSRLELMLAHELAHLRRRDLLWLWLFTLGETLFFFHPLVWLARREWTLATEAACDEMAIRLTRQTPRDYGEMLVDIVAATSRRANVTPLIAVGIVENAHTLKRRLKLMITTRTRIASIGGIALISIATLLLVPWKLTAQDADAEAVAKLKEENAKLRKELETVRKDAEKVRSDAERIRKQALDENDPLNERRRAEERKRFARTRDARELERQRIMEQMETQLEALRSRFTDDHPTVREQKVQIEKMRADSERLGWSDEDEIQAINRASERNRREYEQEKRVAEAKTRLEELRAQFSDENPLVRRGQTQLEQLEAETAAAKGDPGVSLKPPSRTRTAFVPLKEPAMKRREQQEQQRALLQKELELVEREVEITRKNVEAGVQSRSALLAAQRELLEVKLQIAGLSASKDDARAVIHQQIEIANKMLKEHKQLVEQGLVAAGSEIPLEREVLRLTRKLHELEASAGRE